MSKFLYKSKRILIILILLIFKCICFAQESIISSHVQDAETGEPLPYVRVSAAKGGTITNTDGDFRLKVSDDDIIQLSYVGYEKLRFNVTTLPRVIKLKPYTKNLSEVTVHAKGTDIVDNVIKKLEQDYKIHKRDKKLYLFRTTLEREDEALLIELLIKAYSSVNIRGLSIASGAMNLYGDNAKPIPLSLSNIHRHAEIAPKTYDSEFWSYPIKPLDDIVKTRKYYQQEVETMQGEKGEKLFRITFKWKNIPLKSADADRRYITGTMMVEAGSCRILNFDGVVNNTYQWVDNIRTSSQIKFHIDYDYHRGYAAVSNVTVQGGNEQMRYKTMMYSLDDTEKLAKIKAPSGSDIVSKIADAGYDSVLWSKYNLVKKTEAEEYADKGISQFTQSHKIFKADLADTINADPRLRDFCQQIIKSSKFYPQEKVYLHMDNTCYFQGDTIWYSAYLHNTGHASNSSTSGLLYVELYTPEGYLIERQNVMMRDGCGHGNFVLDDKAMYGGYYEIRAYTNWQLNWGAHQEKQHVTDYDKLYSRVFPVYDKPLTQGDYSYDMTTHPLRRHFSSDPDQPTPKLRLYPEGGNLVEGVPCNIAYEAQWSDGRYMDGTLQIGTEKSTSVHRGKGVITIIPNSTNTIAIFTSNDGTKIQTPLPPPQKDGVVLRVNKKEFGWNISVQCAGNTHKKPLGLTVMQDGCLEIFRPLQDTISVFTFLEEFLKPGVNQATVYDTDGKVLADRLFFVRHKDQEAPPIKITGADKSFSPYEKIDLTISAVGLQPAEIGKRNQVSLAVRDNGGIQQSYDNGNIYTELLLSSEVKGFIPQPQWYFEKDDSLHRQALDLLMMTQGWRRFSWQEMTSRIEQEPVHSKEKTKILHGTVFQYDTEYVSSPNDEGNDDSNKKDSIQGLDGYKPSINQERQTTGLKKASEIMYIRVIAIRTDIVNPTPQGALIKVVDGRFALDFPNLQGTGILFLDLEAEVKKTLPKNLFIQMDNQYPVYVNPYTFYQTHQPKNHNNPMVSDFEDRDSTTVLQELQVQKNLHGLSTFNDATPLFCVGSLEAENLILDTGNGFSRPFSYSQLANALYGKMGDDFSANITMRYGITPTRRLLEGMDKISKDSIYSRKHLKSYPANFPFSPGEIAEMKESGVERYMVYTDYSPRLRESKRYQGANKPEIVIVEYPYADGLKHDFPSLRCLPFPSYSYADSFYSPDYSKQSLPETPDYRRTLYWNPNLQLDENGEAQVTFYNNSRTTHLSIEAEGQGADGALLWGKEGN